MKHLAHENKFAAFVAVANAVADHALAEHGRKFGREVAYLIGVREKDEVRLGGLDHLLEGDAVSIGRVGFEQIVLNEQDFRDVLLR